MLVKGTPGDKRAIIGSDNEASEEKALHEPRQAIYRLYDTWRVVQK